MCRSRRLTPLAYCCREVATTDEGYVRWTQWVFCKLFEKGLARQEEASVNWCPKLGTVLANEEVIGGTSERGGHPVVRTPLRQWVLEITKYADRLLDGLDGLDWPKGTMESQRQWIGRSEGCTIKFSTDGGDDVEVFTTRCDTLMGVTYVCLAPENKLGESVRGAKRRAEKACSLKIHASPIPPCETLLLPSALSSLTL